MENRGDPREPTLALVAGIFNHGIRGRHGTVVGFLLTANTRELPLIPKGHTVLVGGFELV